LLVPKPGTIGAKLKELGAEEGIDILDLLVKGAGGDKAASEAAIAFLRRTPEAVEVVISGSTTMQADWVAHTSKDPFTRYVLEERCRKRRRELGGENPTMLERLLVDRIVICGLQVEIAEGRYIRVMEESTTFARAKFYEDSIDRAQHRYLAAIKALAQIRRLQLPTVAQLNVATNQVNLAQTAAATGGQAPASPPPTVLPDHGVLTKDDVLGGSKAAHVSTLARSRGSR
jgi:hypothetical protein